MKKISLYALAALSICQVASAGGIKSVVDDVKNSVDSDQGNALDGSWKWQKAYCNDKKINPAKSNFQKSVLTFSGGSGYLISNSKHPVGREHKAELEKVTYLSDNQIKLECSELSRNDKETKDLCAGVERTYTYVHDGGMLDLRFEDKGRCDGTLRDVYKLEK